MIGLFVANLEVLLRCVRSGHTTKLKILKAKQRANRQNLSIDLASANGRYQGDKEVQIQKRGGNEASQPAREQ